MQEQNEKMNCLLEKLDNLEEEIVELYTKMNNSNSKFEIELDGYVIYKKFNDYIIEVYKFILDNKLDTTLIHAKKLLTILTCLTPVASLIAQCPNMVLPSIIGSIYLISKYIKDSFKYQRLTQDDTDVLCQKISEVEEKTLNVDIFFENYDKEFEMSEDINKKKFLMANEIIVSILFDGKSYTNLDNETVNNMIYILQNDLGSSITDINELLRMAKIKLIYHQKDLDKAEKKLEKLCKRNGNIIN